MKGLNFNKTYSLAAGRRTAHTVEVDNNRDDGFDDESSFGEDSLTFSFTFLDRCYTWAIF